MEVLTLLEEYYEAHEAAAAEFSSAQWNLTKARRSATARSALTVSTPFEASSLRPELQAQTVVLVEHGNGDDDDGEPDLLPEPDVKEASSKNDAHHHKISPRYAVINLSDEREKHKENAQQQSSSDPGSNSNNADGLRQRKGKVETKAESTATTTMTQEEPQDSSNGSSSTNTNDPVLLLAGLLPPRELRVAQQKATAALQKYVRVANLIVALQKELLVAEEEDAAALSAKESLQSDC